MTPTYEAPIEMPQAALEQILPGEYRCVVRVTISVEGVPTSAEADPACDPLLRGAASAGVMGWRFVPPVDKNGLPIAVRTEVRVAFRIRTPSRELRLGISGGQNVAPPPEGGRPFRDAQLLGHLGLATDGILMDVAVGTRGGGFYAATELGVWADDPPVRFVGGPRLGVVSATVRGRLMVSVGVGVGLASR